MGDLTSFIPAFIYKVNPRLGIGITEIAPPLKLNQKITGVPIVLNTSFNENEPVVCKPEEAIDCFLRTKMDVLVLGDTLIQR